MYFSNSDKNDKLGFSGSYSSLIEEIVATSAKNNQYIPLFTIFLEEIPELESYFLSLFLDINFADEKYIIPPMSTVDTFPNTLTEDQLIQQQVGYKIIIGKLDQYQSEVESFVIPKFIYRGSADKEGVNFGKMNHLPSWKFDDETPPNGPEGTPKFLFQISEGFMFDTVPNAPRQKVVDYLSTDMTSLREEQKYQLFAGNEVYFFAYADGDQHIPFVVVQS